MDGTLYGEAYFQPMVSLVKYLYENDYKIYIVSATYRDAVRVMTEGVLDEYIPSDRVIGTDLLYVASGDEAENNMFYKLEPQDELVISGSLLSKNQKTNKAAIIQQEIGKVPVLAFGNSTGISRWQPILYRMKNTKAGHICFFAIMLSKITETPKPQPLSRKNATTTGFILFL